MRDHVRRRSRRLHRRSDAGARGTRRPGDDVHGVGPRRRPEFVASDGRGTGAADARLERTSCDRRRGHRDRCALRHAHRTGHRAVEPAGHRDRRVAVSPQRRVGHRHPIVRVPPRLPLAARGPCGAHGRVRLGGRREGSLEPRRRRSIRAGSRMFVWESTDAEELHTILSTPPTSRPMDTPSQRVLRRGWRYTRWVRGHLSRTA